MATIDLQRLAGVVATAIGISTFMTAACASDAANSAASATAAIPTLDELATEWLDVNELAHMPSLHNYHDMAACSPDLIGVNGDRAAELLRSRGLRVSVVGEQPYPGVPAGIVLRQLPQAGFQIAPGEPISIEVSR